jgi:hypothetical protein
LGCRADVAVLAGGIIWRHGPETTDSQSATTDENFNVRDLRDYARQLAERQRVFLVQRRSPDVPCTAGVGASFEYLTILRELP